MGAEADLSPPPLEPTDEGLTRQCLRIVDLGFRGRTTMEILGARLGTRCTQLRVPSVEDPYVLLAIQYMIIVVLQGAAVGGSMLFLVYLDISLYCRLFIECSYLALYMQPG